MTTFLSNKFTFAFQVKSLHFKAVAHYYAALILLQNYGESNKISWPIT